jgi:hypothetical protein
LLAPGFGSALYRFDGQAGQEISIALSTGDPDWYFDVARWMLIDPQGNLVMSGDSRTPMETSLSTTGAWSLLILGRQASWEVVGYSLTVTETATA